MRLYNSLSRKVEEVVAYKDKKMGMYACGLTVYDFAHIGHGRKYVMDDVLRRTLSLAGFEVNHVRNITDVGHLVSDADEGEDKLEKGAKKFGKTVWEVAEFFTKASEASLLKLNILPPQVLCKATEHIPEQIEMIKKLIDGGYAYDTPEAVYFQVEKFADYDKLFGQNLSDKLVAARSEVITDSQKKNPVDFALWFKRVGKYADHTMHWDSPWGDGFPGWHVECSAMSVKYLGEQFEIHTGGIDHQSIHHPNEIAQSEAATGKKPFVKYWVHHNFLKVDGKKMSKSLGNVYQVEDIINKGFDPLALRYLFLSAHYRKPLNFTWVSLEAAASALEKLRRAVNVSEGIRGSTPKYEENFRAALMDDLNTPEALAVVWEVAKDKKLSPEQKRELLLKFDEVLGLGLDGANDTNEHQVPISKEIKELVAKRDKLRKERKWDEADKVRKEIEKLGFEVIDGDSGATVKAK